MAAVDSSHFIFMKGLFLALLEFLETCERVHSNWNIVINRMYVNDFGFTGLFNATFWIRSVIGCHRG